MKRSHTQVPDIQTLHRPSFSPSDSMTEERKICPSPSPSDSMTEERKMDERKIDVWQQQQQKEEEEEESKGGHKVITGAIRK